MLSYVMICLEKDLSVQFYENIYFTYQEWITFLQPFCEMRLKNIFDSIFIDNSR